MAETYNGGITLTWPSAGEVDWVTVYRSFARTISDHDHTGGGRGTKISGSALSVDAFTGASFRLDFNEWLRSRNDTNITDVNILRITTGNELEIGPVMNATEINVDTLSAGALSIADVAVDKLFVNTPSVVTTTAATIVNTGDNEIALQLTSPVGRLKTRLDANALPGDVITTDYYNNGVLKFTQTVEDTGYLGFYPAGGQAIRFGLNSLTPVNDAAYTLGASNAKFLDAYIVRTNTSDIRATTTLDFKVNGASKLTLDSTGNLVPAATNTQNLGSSSLKFLNAYVSFLSVGDLTAPLINTSEIFATSTFSVAVNGTKKLYVDATGHTFPGGTNAQDMGTSSVKWRTGYFATSVDTPAITGPTWTGWTPGVTGSTSPTIINVRGRYIIIGKMLSFEVSWGTANGVNAVSWSIPFSGITPAISFPSNKATGPTHCTGPGGSGFYWGFWNISGAGPTYNTVSVAYFSGSSNTLQLATTGAGAWEFKVCGTVELT